MLSNTDLLMWQWKALQKAREEARKKRLLEREFLSTLFQFQISAWDKYQARMDELERRFDQWKARR